MSDELEVEQTPEHISLLKEEEVRIRFLELKAVATKLAKFHGIFYKMWSYGNPVWTRKIDTAAAVFNEKGNAFKFMFNPDFWAKLNDYDRAFIVSHECLHVLLNHGSRGLFATRTGHHEQANIAMDLAINHMLEDQFGFSRKLLGEEIRDKLVYNETFYPSGTQFASDDTFEEHYVRISRLIESGKIKEIKVPGLDDHSYMQPNEKGGDAHIRETAKELSANERQKLVDAVKKSYKQAGNERGLNWLDINASRPRKKRKWEQCVKLWNHNAIFHDDDLEENFMKPDRRLGYFQPKAEHFFLPGDNPTYIKKKDRKRIKLFLFLDVSGSCVHLKDYFFEAGRTFPPERFEVRAFTFNTEVQEVDIYTDKIIGNGGTSFTCIENYINEHFPKYPKNVFVFTDGYGDNVNPLHPERWYWFMTEEHGTECIPTTSNIFHLSDFVPEGVTV
jgi:DNA-binding cell septation regulator SpoVG